MSFLDRIRQGLTKTRDALFGGVASVLQSGAKLTDADYEALEAALLRADVGPTTTDKLLDDVRRRLADTANAEPAEVMRDAIRSLLEGGERGVPEGTVSLASRVPEGTPRSPQASDAQGRGAPRVTLVIGVNGSGKTTTIAKLASRYKQAGRSVLLVASDTFRAAAADQLTIWANRAGVEIVQAQPGADPAAVAYDGMVRAKTRGSDEVIVDTAGRLHVQANLMAELAKIGRVIGRAIPGAPHETLLVLDATVGQNGLHQAREFGRALEVTGLVLTKLDGTAKGGIVLAVADALRIPIRWIGVGEGMEDLLPFQAEEFAAALVPS